MLIGAMWGVTSDAGGGQKRTSSCEFDERCHWQRSFERLIADLRKRALRAARHAPQEREPPFFCTEIDTISCGAAV